MREAVDLEVLQVVARQACGRRNEDDVIDFLVEAVVSECSFDRMDRKLALKGGLPPICRNTFYLYRRRILAGLDKELRTRA